MLTVSPTSIQTYLTCPRQYKYEKVMGIRPRVETPTLPLGRAGHTAIEHYYLHHKHPALTFREEVKKWRDSSGIYDEELDKKVEAMAQVLELYPGWSAEVDNFEVINCEVPFQLAFGRGRGRFVLNGRFDMVVRAPTGLWLLDHKFVDQFWSESEVELNLQATLYTLAATLLWPSEKFNGLIFNFIKKSVPKTTPPFKREYAYRNAAQLEAAKKHLAHTVQCIRRDKVFVPAPSRNCRSCKFQSLCIAEDDGTGFEAMLQAGYVVKAQEKRAEEQPEEELEPVTASLF